MSKTINIELDEALLSVMIDISTEERGEVVAERDRLDEKIRALDKAIASFEAKLSDAKPVAVIRDHVKKAATPPKTPRGRVKRGHTKRLVERFLKSRNGTGSSVAEITRATGTKYNTVHRIVAQLASANKVTQGTRSKWNWNSK